MPSPGNGISAISAGAAIATGPGVSFANGGGITFGIAGNTITATVGAVGAAASISIFKWADWQTHNTVWPGQVSFQAVTFPLAISGSSGYVMIDVLGNSNSSGGITIHAGAYQLSGSTASALTVRSAGFTWSSGSATSASSLYGGVSGTRYRSFPWDVEMVAGDYLFAFAISTQNDGTARMFGRQGANIVGSFAGAETNYLMPPPFANTITATVGAVSRSMYRDRSRLHAFTPASARARHTID